MSRYLKAEKKKWRPQVGCWLRNVCSKCTAIDEIVQMCHYLLYTSVWVSGDRQKIGERERPGGSSCLREYPSCQFHSDLCRVLPKQGDKWPSHIVIRERYQWTGTSISHPSSPITPVQTMCACLCAGVYVCVVEQSWHWAGPQGRGALLVTLLVCVSLSLFADQGFYVGRKSDWLWKIDMMSSAWKLITNQIIITKSALPLSGCLNSITMQTQS